MAAYPELDDTAHDSEETPVELLVVGCSLSVADGFANALRDQGQAAHLKTAETLASLDQHLSSDSCELVVINADSRDIGTVEVIGKVRARNPTARQILVSRTPSSVRDLAVSQRLQDVIPIDETRHIALAVRREHEFLQMLHQVRRLQRQLDEAEDRSNLLVQSSRDAIAYVHEGMYLNANQAYLDTFGYEANDEIDGLTIMDAIDAESRAAFKAALRMVNDNGRHAEEFRCVTAEGNRFNARIEFCLASIDGEQCTQVLIRDQSQNMALQKRIEELTSRDAQTGFFNRQSFMERLEGLLVSEQHANAEHALVQLSITNYPQMRETCGYNCAEQMLTEAANVIAATATRAHTLARFGDHDFMILCNDDEPALEIAERCLHNLRNHAFKGLDEAPVKPTYSIGVTRAEQNTEITAHELINQSCRATGIARSDGDNRVVFYNNQMPGDTQQLAEDELAIVRLIDNALANDGFRLKYQPIVSLQGDTRESYSVYLRLIDDKGAELVPEVFLSPARDASRMSEIDRWVVRNAIRELASHRRDGKKIIFYVILSRAGIEDDSMLLWIVDCLREFRAKGSWLVFQFRESDLRAALRPARELIDGLKRINCRIAVNNYSRDGEGLLKHLPIDIVKLSPELMRGLATEAAQQKRMTEINSELQEAGFKTIASGIEDAGSLAILWNIGVNCIQGHFLQEPSSTITFEQEAGSLG